MQTPAKAFLGVEGVQNRWDELQFLHILLANVVHDVVCPPATCPILWDPLNWCFRGAISMSRITDNIQGAFLPWHRLLLHAHEYLQKTECGYEGTQP